MTIPTAKTRNSSAAISMDIRGGRQAPLRARQSVLSRLDGRLADTRVSDIALVVSELVTNSVRHASVGSRQTVKVELTSLEDRLRITVTDSGSQLQPRIRRPDAMTPGGFGLVIVEELSCAWGVTRDRVGATSVWCELLTGCSPQPG